MKPSHGFAIGNVGEIKDACLSYGAKVRVIHEPQAADKNPAYTAIRNYKSGELELLDLLAGEAWCDVVAASDLL